MPWNDDRKPGPWSSPGGKDDGAQRPAAEPADTGRRRGPWDIEATPPPPKEKRRGLTWRGEALGAGLRRRGAATEPDNSGPARGGGRGPATGARKPTAQKSTAQKPAAQQPTVQKPNAPETKSGGPWGNLPVRPDPPKRPRARSADLSSAPPKIGDRPQAEAPRKRPGLDPSGARTGQAKRAPTGPPKVPGPTLDELSRDLRARFQRRFGAKSGRGLRPRVVAGVLGVVFAAWALSGVYVVQADQRSLVTRFGAFVGEDGPGLNYHLPWPIEQTQLVPVTRSNRLEVGGAGGVDQGVAGGMIPTRDGEMVDIDFAVRWRVADPAKFLFNIAEPEQTVKAVALSAMREVVARSSMGQLSAAAPPALADQALALMQSTLDRYGAGVVLSEPEIRSVSPPPEVLPAYREASTAGDEAQAAVAQANAYRDRELADARGDAAKIVQDAQGYSDQIVREAQGQADHFSAVEAEYSRAPAITRQRLYLETMEQVLGHAKKLVLDLPKGSASVVLPPDLFRQGVATVGTGATSPSQASQASSAPAPSGAVSPPQGGAAPKGGAAP